MPEDIYRDVHGNIVDLSKSPAFQGSLPTFGPSPNPPRNIPESEKATPQDIAQTAEKAAPYAGRFAVTALPIAGAPFGIPGVAAASAVSLALRNQFPGIFGEASPSIPGQLLEFGADVGMQGLLPKVVEDIATTGIQGYGRQKLAQLLSSRAASALPSVRRGIYGGLEKQIQNRFMFPESQIVETAASNAQAGIPSVGGRITPQQLAGIQAFPELQNVPYQQTGASQQSIKAITDKALSDVNQVRNFRLSTGEPHTISHLAANEILTGSMKGG